MTITAYRLTTAPAEEPKATAFTDSPGQTAPARLVLSSLSLLFLLVGLVGLIAGIEALRVLGLGGYFLLGTGAAPWALNRRMGLSLRTMAATSGSLVILILVSILMMYGDAWHPSLAATMIILVTAPVHVLGVLRAVRDRPLLPLRPWPAFRPPLAIAAGGAILCLIAALTHRHLDPGIGGFLTQIGPIWYVGLALILIALAMARSGDEMVLAVGVTLLMLVLTGTAALVYDAPRSQSAAKHLDFIQQIRQNHHLDSSVGVYNSWPGYFSSMAWFSDVTGLRDPLGLATAWPVLIGVSRIAAMRYLAGQVLSGRVLPWLAVLLGVLADPIGADYFSPQSVGFVLGLAIFGLALSKLPTWPRLGGILAIGAAVTVTHQLSPYIIGGTLCVFAVFRLLKPWWFAAALIGEAFAWAFLHWSDLGGFVSLGDVGNASNFRPPETAATTGLERLPIVGLASYTLAAGILVIGLLALVTLARRWKDPAAWAFALAPSVGVAVLAVNAYGNEGIFRAALFAIPWLSILAVSTFAKLGTRRVNLGLGAVLVTLAVTFNIAAFGMDASAVMRPSDRDAVKWFEAQALQRQNTVSYLLVVGPGDLPNGPPTEAGTYVTIDREDIDPQAYTLTDPADTTMTRMTGQLVKYGDANTTGAFHLYAVWSPTNEYYGLEYGLHTKAQFTALRDAFSASSLWTKAFTEGDTVVWEYTAGTGTGS
ncbi:hypothetical protein BJ973_006623 [Actinoplanes tereljensis]|uniref:Uncharacterized protein n=1 Tax=Paractinoplanes tereljensis TaxID=571912 RepID=A0A919NKL4_9ACTN|nr:hypothetical protein [Actinoplanes tereljensis]GIF19577.1 hypothetical protein Ate02nite_23070 [Actinoplanes tereljensis]